MNEKYVIINYLDVDGSKKQVKLTDENANHYIEFMENLKQSGCKVLGCGGNFLPKKDQEIEESQPQA